MTTPTPAAEPVVDPDAEPVEPTEEVDDLEPDDTDTDPEGAEQLGDPGKKAEPVEPTEEVDDLEPDAPTPTRKAPSSSATRARRPWTP